MRQSKMQQITQLVLNQMMLTRRAKRLRATKHEAESSAQPAETSSESPIQEPAKKRPNLSGADQPGSDNEEKPVVRLKNEHIFQASPQLACTSRRKTPNGPLTTQDLETSSWLPQIPLTHPYESETVEYFKQQRLRFGYGRSSEGFYARPSKHSDGSVNYLLWECAVPVRMCDSEGMFRFELIFVFDPPQCNFLTSVYHPNIRDDGVALIPKSPRFHSRLRIETLLRYIQSFLMYPNKEYAGNAQAYLQFIKNELSYQNTFVTHMQEHHDIEDVEPIVRRDFGIRD